MWWIIILFSVQTSDYGLRENVDGHPTRFQLYKKKETLTFQADTVEEKNVWVQDIWDLFFSHMLNLKGAYAPMDVYIPSLAVQLGVWARGSFILPLLRF